jgi:hypothetical protein
MELRTLDEWQAFVAMARFLEDYWEQTGRPTDIGGVLSSIGKATPGKTADPAIWHDWAAAVGEVLEEKSTPEHPFKDQTLRQRLVALLVRKNLKADTVAAAADLVAADARFQLRRRESLMAPYGELVAQCASELSGFGVYPDEAHLCTVLWRARAMLDKLGGESPA